jgi:hypothetical protein
MKIRVLGLIVARGWELCSAESLACADLFLGQINEISSAVSPRAAHRRSVIAPDANGISKIATIADSITTVRKGSAHVARLPLTTAARRRGQHEGHA